jgi:pyruvate kinase
MVFFDDGKLRAEVIDVEEDAVKVRFKEGGFLAPSAQIRLQGPKYETIPLLQGSDIMVLKEIYAKFPYEYVSVPCV